jgi:hypothetical protein
MLYATHQSNRLGGPGGMWRPLVGHRGQLNGLLRRQHIGFKRDDDIDLALALERGERRSIEKASIFEEQIPSPQHRRLLQQGTAQDQIVHLDR